MREGRGNCPKYLKRGGTEKRKGETKIFKMGWGWVGGGGQAVSRGRYLEKEGWNPLTNYDTLVITF